MGRPSPLTLNEIRPVFDRLLTRPVALAVSGGADSMALMHLVAAWSAERGGLRPTVLTVDHGLRPESAREAADVAAAAAGLGLAHATLVWSGTKPASGLQAAAREARYRLMQEHLAREAGENGWARTRAIVTAHHADDQAETFLMRLARGSGLDGLSGMREIESIVVGGPEGSLSASCTIIRPLLAITKGRVIATLEASSVAWHEDPSNISPDFERVRMRELLQVMEGAGIGAEQILRSTQRLARARAAVAAGLAEVGPRLARVNNGVFAEVDAELFLRLPEELQVRSMAMLLAAFGGVSPPARLSQVEALAATLREPDGGSSSPALTLGGCRVARRRGGDVVVWREAGRNALPEIELKPGSEALWDCRFVVSLDGSQAAGVRVRALGSEGLRHLGRSAALLVGPDAEGAPRGALETLPSFWRGEQLVGAPNFKVDEPPEAGCRARFVALNPFSANEPGALAQS